MEHPCSVKEGIISRVMETIKLKYQSFYDVDERECIFSIYCLMVIDIFETKYYCTVIDEFGEEYNYETSRNFDTLTHNPKKYYLINTGKIIDTYDILLDKGFAFMRQIALKFGVDLYIDIFQSEIDDYEAFVVHINEYPF